MTSHWIKLCTLICSFGLVVGCGRENQTNATNALNAFPSVEQGVQPASSSVLRAASDSPEGWREYKSLEGGFAVSAPSNPPKTTNNTAKMWNVRTYTFQDGETPLSIEVYSDRTGVLATNSVDELRDSPDIVPGTLREVSLPGMPGIEFRSMGTAGEVVHREYCSPDKTRSITMHVQKDVGSGISEEKVKVFLDSFAILK